MAASQNKGLKSTFVGIVVSAILAVLKAAGGIFGNSYALIADAIESTADIFTSSMLWLGLKWASRPADEDHPYGHGKAEALIAIGIGAALTIAAVVIGKESIHNIITPHKSPAAYTLIILLVVIATKEILYRYVKKTGVELNSQAIKADAFHHRSDAITSAAAFIGISISLLGGKGYEAADDYAALFAGVIILINVYHIVRPAIGELLDEDLDPSLNERVRELAAEVTGVTNVEKCHTRKMGVHNHADLHIWVDGNLSVTDGHTISHAVKDHIQETLPQFIEVMIHIEPDGHYQV
ncbi:cation diffusion facilitator family transporter [Flavobacterium sp. DG1-102-2]|uniref:cation diffusion facilitator family transporter n=1 Tax=Flavobacterium sp. DG1-102-2 TaxID=3081663 RepID=UPI0029493BC4|nr:cation diffusion facilitator family transporter [Flavobacterium sp. DG1-102-2]MDV6169716.1 cation diffusion facilitator family transporter [Flavobacterium sp. DG1-102-2]